MYKNLTVLACSNSALICGQSTVNSIQHLFIFCMFIGFNTSLLVHAFDVVMLCWFILNGFLLITYTYLILSPLLPFQNENKI